MLRDKIMLNNSVFLLSSECRACGLKDHLIEYCEKIHLVINKNVKIKQHLYSQPINERGFFLRKRKKINSLKILNECAISSSNFEDSLNGDEDKDLDTQLFERQSALELDSRREILTNETNETKKDITFENPKKTQKSSSFQPFEASDSLFTCKLSNHNKEKPQINLDKVQKFKYYYPNFNFKNPKKSLPRMPSARKLKNGISSEKKKAGLFKVD